MLHKSETFFNFFYLSEFNQILIVLFVRFFSFHWNQPKIAWNYLLYCIEINLLFMLLQTSLAFLLEKGLSQGIAFTYMLQYIVS